MEPTDPPKYWAFISYSHADSQWGDWLHRAMETYRVPRRLVGTPTRSEVMPARLRPIFRDREEFAASADLGGRLQDALAGSRFLVVICSPNAAGSRWVNEEIRCFQKLGRSAQILAMIVAGEPHASGIGLSANAAPIECFPPALRFQSDAMGALTDIRADPVAADARAGKDGRRNALLKLVAGILGVDYDALRQREQQRRRLRVLLLGAAICCLAAAFVGVWQWQETRRRDTREQIERDNARQHARRTADEKAEEGRRLLITNNLDLALDPLVKAHEAASEDPSIRLMLAAVRSRLSHLCVLRLKEDTQLSQVLIDPSGKFLLPVGESNPCNLRTLPDGTQQGPIPFFDREGSPPSYAEFSERGDKRLLIYHDRVVVQDAATGKLLREVKGFEKARFVGEGSRFIVWRDGDEDQPIAISDYDVSQREDAGRSYSLGPGTVGELILDRAGRTGLARCFRPTASGAGRRGGEPHLVWFDLANGTILADLPCPKDVKLGPGTIRPDGGSFLYPQVGKLQIHPAPAGGGEGIPVSGSLRFARWLPDGQAILVSDGRFTTPYDGKTLSPRWRVARRYSDPVFDASGDLCACIDENHFIHILDVSTGKDLASLENDYTDPISGGWQNDEKLMFAPDRRHLVISGLDNVIRIWDWQAASGARDLGEPGGPAAYSAVFGPDGRTLAVSGHDHLSIRDLDDAAALPKLLPNGTTGGAWSVAFQPDSEKMIVGTAEPPGVFAGTLWDTHDYQLLAWLDDQPESAKAASMRSPILEQHLCFVWKRDTLVSANFARGKVGFWDLHTTKCLREADIASGGLNPDDLYAHRLAVSHDGSRIIVAGLDGKADIFDPAGDRVASLSSSASGDAVPLRSADLDDDASRALTVDEKGIATVWDVARGQSLISTQLPLSIPETVCMSPDGNLLAVGTDTGVELWDINGKQRIDTLREEAVDELATSTSAFLSVQFDPRGRWLVALSEDGVCLWDPRTRRQLLRWRLDLPTDSRYHHLAVSPDGDRLAIYGWDGLVRMIDLKPAPDE